jgi:hypothetical protein
VIDTIHTPIVALDPGETTGVAWYCMDKIFFREMGPQPHHAELRAFLDVVGPRNVVVENFENRNNPAAILVSLEYIGVCREWTQTKSGTKLTVLGSSASKSVWPDKKLRKLPIDLPPAKPRHQRDALRVLLLFIQRDLRCHDYVRLATAPGEHGLLA